jgi:alpha-aminoadipic semialdehyde synthase
MIGVIGLRREDKDIAERRAPLNPAQVNKLIQEYNFIVRVQPAENRVFTDKEYQDAGAVLSDDLRQCNLIFGAKEIPIDRFLPNKAYCFFSHTIKGQRYNMPMLKHILDLKITLMDYEKVSDENNRRLIYFGRFAGCAGMIRSLWAFGQRLSWEGIENPFTNIKRAYEYHSLDEAKHAIKAIGQEILQNGLPQTITPLVCGFTGYGNVSLGAQEIYDLLPCEEIKPGNLQKLFLHGDFSNKCLYKVIFKEEDIFQPRDAGQSFQLLDYYQHPENYKSKFENYIPFLSILINAIYWSENYPRLVTKKYLKKLFYRNEQPNVRVIGDISCDVEGSIECTLETTTFEKPVYVYNPKTEKIKYGIEGRGPVVLALDRLPNEFAKEATEAFGDALMPFIPELGVCDFRASFPELILPQEFKKAVIVHRGDFTPAYEYLRPIINEMTTNKNLR